MPSDADRVMNPLTIARKFLTVWNAGNFGAVDEFAAPDILVDYPHFPKPIRGPEELKAALKQTARCFPDIRIEADEVLAQDDRVVIFWTYRGTHREGELFGLQPTGRKVQVSGVSRYTIHEGKVVEERGLVDNFSLFQQLQTDRSDEEQT
jgi:steroid delta-isomerase-like uncharacterized protein